MRIKQKSGTKGSLKWTQRLINDRPEVIEVAICAAGILPTGASVDWISPRHNDEWAEYRDGAFLDRIGRGDLKTALLTFWPKRGPQWDALGRSGDTVYLIEAKAHPSEMASDCTASAKTSLDLISASLDNTKTAYGAGTDKNWLKGHYQFANRLAHLKFLRDHGVDAQLVFIYFVGDGEMTDIRTKDGWQEAITNAYEHLGISASTPIPHVTSIFLDVSAL